MLRGKACTPSALPNHSSLSRWPHSPTAHFFLQQREWVVPRSPACVAHVQGASLGRLPWVWEGQQHKQHKQEWVRQQVPGSTSFGSHSPRPAEGKVSTIAAVLSRDDFALSCPQSLLTQSWHFYVDSGVCFCHQSVRICTCFHRSSRESPNTRVFHLMEMKPSQAASGVPAAAERPEWLPWARINPGCHCRSQ